MNMKILRLNKAGVPIAWLSKQDAATLICKERVVWSMGDFTAKMRGGFGRNGRQSILLLPSIVACSGKINAHDFVPPLENKFLFKRDNYTCMYCGGEFYADTLSRDHVHPQSRGGADAWMNVVTACRRCNNRKADRTPEEASMELLAVPFVPNRYEFLYLSNHNVLADQMEFLRARFSKNAYWI